jgi:secondary thiamine-phosphate synthase enzyme
MVRRTKDGGRRGLGTAGGGRPAFDAGQRLRTAGQRAIVAGMKQATDTLRFETHGKGLTEITGPVSRWVGASGIGTGLLTLFCRHTSASLVVQENADPDVRADLEAFFETIAPESPGRYVHGAEGPDDMPAHIRAALTQSQVSIPVAGGRPALGTWQGIYLFEHRRAPHRREVALHIIGA